MGTKISQLPNAAALDGTESFPCVQNGTSVKASAFQVRAGTPLFTSPVITVGNQAATLSGSRQIAATAPVTLTDGGAGSTLTVGLTTPLAQGSGGTGVVSFAAINNARLSKTANYSVQNSNKTNTIALSGDGAAAIKTLTFDAASGYDADFMVLVLNEDTRGWSIAPNGVTAFILWPGQTVIVFNQNNTWKLCPSFQRYRAPTVIINVDPINGLDSNDGLATNNGAMRTVLAAWNLIRDYTDGPANIQLALGATFGAIGELDGDASCSYGRLINIIGDSTLVNPPTVSITAGQTGIVVRDGAWASFNGIAFTSSSGSDGVSIQQKALADFRNIRWGGTFLGTHIRVDDGGAAGIAGDETITGAAAVHWYVSGGAKLIVGGVTINGGNGAYNFASGFLLGTVLARVDLQSPTISQCGSFTGPRYALSRHSLTTSAGVVLPGNSAGTTDATSNYY